MIDYNQDRPGDEETGYRLNQHRFMEGEYVTIQDEDGKPYTFQVVSVTPVGSRQGRGASMMRRLTLLCLTLAFAR